MLPTSFAYANSSFFCCQCLCIFGHLTAQEYLRQFNSLKAAGMYSRPSLPADLNISGCWTSGWRASEDLLGMIGRRLVTFQRLHMTSRVPPDKWLWHCPAAPQISLSMKFCILLGSWNRTPWMPRAYSAGSISLYLDRDYLVRITLKACFPDLLLHSSLVELFNTGEAILTCEWVLG